MLKPKFVLVRDYPDPKLSPKWDWYLSHTYIVRVGQVFRCPHCGQLYVFGIKSSALGEVPELYSTEPAACVHVSEIHDWAGKAKNRHVWVHFYAAYEVPHPLAVVPDDELHPEEEYYDLTDDYYLDYEEAIAIDQLWENLPE